ILRGRHFSGSLKIAVPTRSREPDFDLDIRIAGRLQRGGHAAEFRQVPENCAATTAASAGGVNCPAATVCANVIVVFGNENDFRLSHGAANSSAVRIICM